MPAPTYQPDSFRAIAFPGSAFRPADTIAWTTTAGVLTVAATTTVLAPFSPAAGDSWTGPYVWTEPAGPWFGPGVLAPGRIEQITASGPVTVTGHHRYDPAGGPYLVAVDLPVGVGLRGVRLDGLGPTSGVFLIDPVRVYDSRNGGYLLAPGWPAGKLVTGGALGFSLEGAVPNYTSGALLTITLDETEGSGFLVVWSGSQEPPARPPATSTVNWYGDGQIVANQAICRLGGEASLAIASGGNGRTHVIVDVVGYLT